ncbi:DET1 homolog isoform X1 [Sipha flava]|uniref:DET1 homolog isoform X1 n=1 Tax=Sipha flava TaxID=143950 RepID=A0A8B8FJT4_9HEMI|nr:DET1 homolog isoform X1 [Sipha flava]
MSKIFSESGIIKQKKVPRRTILRSLYDREINGTKIRMNCVKATYQTVYPNCTIINVEKPPCYLRKFTPDGRHFIAFSHDQTSIEVYDYLGCSMAANLLKNYEGNCIGQNNEGDNVRKRIFERLFKLRYRIRVSPEGEQLNRECSLFTENGHYAVVGSAAAIPEDIRPQFYEIYTNNEAVSPNPLLPLEDYTIHLVNLNIGAVSHYLNFKSDKIFLSHNQGLYLFNNTLAVLSVQHQIIHVYKIIRNSFCLVRKIGRFCYEDDHLLVTSVYTIMNRAMYRPFRENSINGLKHKLMVFLYKKSERESKRSGSQYPLRKFYQYFNQFLSLRMWKMQLLDEEHILIRYASEEVATIKIQEPNTQASFFMVYNMATTTVLEVFENTSDELLKIYEHFCDNFRNSYINPEGFMPCSPANNIHSWESHQKFKNTIINAKFGGTMEANKRILGQLPVAAQSFTSSPYLDTSLYSYDEKWVSPMERPKVVGEYPIRFYSRESGLLSFCLYTSESKGPTLDRRRLVAFTFHPTDPFAISVQRDNFEYVVNFHIRKVYMPE